MFPPTFGPLFHDMMLLLAEGYPHKPSPEHQENCSLGAIAYIKENPIDVRSKNDLLHFLVAMHNHINKKLGTKDDWTVREALNALASRYRSNLKNLERAHQIRIEDHQLLKKVIAENNSYRLQLGLSVRNDIMVEEDDDAMDLDAFYAAWADNTSNHASANAALPSDFLIGMVSILVFLFIWIIIGILMHD